MESKDNLIDWFNENFITLISLGGSTIFIFLISVIGLCWAVSKIPADYLITVSMGIKPKIILTFCF